ncbi:hypothetical protein ID875_15200 [Streptomyces globisporus]|uniref:Uncharacterized protein n=1 Tax=Streptomyces globisporus TaxID=1908 RepID=A0A927BKD0_STRGL|nr:hypothetical protein [Streptomyces globisporus]
METHTIPRGHWFDDDDFRTLVKQVMGLRPRSWSLAEVERATAALGWELREPRTVGHRVWRRFAPRTGPSYGYGLLESDVSDPERIRRLNLSLIDLPDEGEDDVAVADRIRAAWWVMEDELGPPAMWGGYSGPWMLWRRTDVGDPRLAALPDLLLHAHDDGRMSLDLLPPGSDADAVGQASVRGRWYATEPSDLPPASAPTATALPPAPPGRTSRSGWPRPCGHSAAACPSSPAGSSSTWARPAIRSASSSAGARTWASSSRPPASSTTRTRPTRLN